MNLSGALSLSTLLHGTALVAVVLVPGVIGLQGAAVEEPRPFVRLEAPAEFRPMVEFFEAAPQPEVVATPPEDAPEQVEPARPEPEVATAPPAASEQRRRREQPSEVTPVVTGGEAPPDPIAPERVAVVPAPAASAEIPADSPSASDAASDDSSDAPPEQALALALPEGPAMEPRSEPAERLREPAAPAPAAAAAPSVDIDALYASYAAALERLIERHKTYPRVAQRAGLQGTVVVEVRIDGEGRILAVRVLRSSGHGVLDRAAVASIERIGRFNAPPAEVPWGDRPIEIPLQYTL